MNAPSEPELELVRRAAAGDVAAFQRLATEHAARLCSCAKMLCRDDHRADDLVQETLVAAWRSLSRFDGRCRFSTWLFGILRHRFLNSCRGGRNAAPLPLDAAPGDKLADPGATPASQAEAAEDAAQLRTAVARLPDEHRQVIELRFFAGARLEEIATVLDCPLGTVKSRLHHGLEKLRNMKLSVNLSGSDGESPVRKP